MRFFRSLLCAPLPSLLAVLALALGLGAASALGSLLDRLLLRAVPYPEPSKLVAVWRTFPGISRAQFSGFHVETLVKEPGPFEALGAVGSGSASLEGPDGLRPVAAMRVSGELLPLLKVRPTLGRLSFTREEDRFGGPGAVILSHGLWVERFGGDPSLVGRSLRIGGLDRVVVGILPPDFEAPTRRVRRPQVILPIAFEARELTPRASVDYEMVGRLRPGATLAAASAWTKALEGRFQPASAGLRVAPLAEDKIRPFRDRLNLLGWAVGLMLLVACANAGGLLLARQTERQGILVLQGVLGASPRRLAAQVAAEGLGFGLLGALAGLLLEAPLRHFLSTQLGLTAAPPRPLWVLGAAPLLGLLAGLGASLLAAWRALRIRPAESLRGLDRKASSRSGARQLLVAAELALSFVLLAGAGLLLRSLWIQLQRGPGFETRRLHVGSIVVPASQVSRGSIWGPALAARLAELPGMEAALVGNPIPIYNAGGDGHVRGEGQEQEASAWHHFVAGPVAKSFGMRLVAGRDLRVEDRDGVVVSEPLARSVWPNEPAVGRRLGVVGGFQTVVGVVSGAREHGLDEPIRAQYFMPIPPGLSIPSLSVLLRSQADSATLDAQVRGALRAVDPQLAMGHLRRFETVIEDATAGARQAALPLAVLSGVSALLAALGTVGLLTQLFRQRRRELGVRAALGATPFTLAGLVMGTGGRMLAMGLAAGLLGASALGNLLQARVPVLGAFDPNVLTAAALLLAVATLLACLPAAWRAARVSPSEALRSE